MASLKKTIREVKFAVSAVSAAVDAEVGVVPAAAAKVAVAGVVEADPNGAVATNAGGDVRPETILSIRIKSRLSRRPRSIFRRRIPSSVNSG